MQLIFRPPDRQAASRFYVDDEWMDGCVFRPCFFSFGLFAIGLFDLRPLGLWVGWALGPLDFLPLGL